MKALLRIDYSSRIKSSHSRELANYFGKNWQKENPNKKVVFKVPKKQPLPHIQHDTIVGFYTTTVHLPP